MRKSRVTTWTKLLCRAMEMIGVRILWAKPGEASRTLKEMSNVLRLTRAGRDQATAAVDAKARMTRSEDVVVDLVRN